MLSRAGARKGLKYSIQFMCPKVLVNTFFGRHVSEGSGHLLRSTTRHVVETAFSWSGRQGNRAAPSYIRSYSQQQPKEHILAAKEDNYDGIMIDAEQLPTNREQFAQRLDSSLKEWMSKRKRGVWLRLNLSHAGLMEAAISAGFDFHHAEKGALVLSKWLPTDTPDRLPEGATHQVGVGAFVLNERREVLLVQESFGVLRGQGIWKLPTGLSNLGEDVPEAAVREVWEETGIRTTFDRVLAIRQSHGQSLGRSDLFFVCGLKLNAGPQDIVLQTEELAAADWHPLEAAEQLPIFQSGPMFRAVFAQCKAYAHGSYRGMGARKLDNGFNPDSDLLFHA